MFGIVPVSVTWGLKLSFPVTGDTPALNDPSLYGLVDPTSGAADTKNWIGSPNWSAVWNPKNIQTPQADQQQGLIDTGHGVIRPNKDDAWILYGKPKSNSNGTSDLKTVFDPAWGYYFPAIAGPIRTVPAGLALNQWSSASCNDECSTCYIYQNQTNGKGGASQVTVDSYGTYCPPPPPPPSSTPSASTGGSTTPTTPCTSNGQAQVCDDNGKIVANIGAGSGAVYATLTCTVQTANGCDAYSGTIDGTTINYGKGENLLGQNPNTTGGWGVSSSNSAGSADAVTNNQGTLILGANTTGGLIQQHGGTLSSQVNYSNQNTSADSGRNNLHPGVG